MNATYEDLRERWQKCINLARDKSTSQHERDNAQRKANSIQEQMNKLEDSKYLEYVRKGLEVTKKMNDYNWIIGDLSLGVKKDYGKHKLEQYARDIGINFSTLKACRATSEAWPEKVSRLTFWTVHQQLNPHPDRQKLLEKNPKMSKDEAIETTSRWRQEKKSKKKKKVTSKNNGKGSDESQAPSLIGILDHHLVEGGTEQQLLVSLIDIEKEEYALVLDSLSRLQQRVEEAIKHWRRK
jgi:hypothetical protein